MVVLEKLDQPDTGFTRIEASFSALPRQKRKLKPRYGEDQTFVMKNYQELYKACRQDRFLITTKDIGELSERNSFFGSDLLTWLLESNWCEDKESAMVLCQTIYRRKLIVPVYPFVNKFVNDMVAYKFFYDVEEIEVGKQNTLKNATDVCARFLSSNTRKKKLSTSSEGSGKSVVFYDSEIAGNKLMSMIDEGCNNGQATCQLMLRYGYIIPCDVNNADNDVQMRKQQKFFPEYRYYFGDRVNKVSSNFMVYKANQGKTRKKSIVLEAINTKIQEASQGESNGSHLYPIKIKPKQDLQQCSYFYVKPENCPIKEDGTSTLKGFVRRHSTTRNSFFSKFRKKST